MSNVPGAARTNNLAATFQEVLTAILRLRDQPQMVQNTEAVRGQLRQLLQTVMNDARGLGYASQHTQMAVLVVVAFLDETVLSLGTAASAEWSRRPLQEELFGGHLAGETVFQNLQSLLQQQDAPEVADVLELYCLCLELGYKGRYAFSTGGELRGMIQLGREKVHRTRGQQPMFMAPHLAPPVQRPGRDRIALLLLVACIVLGVITVGCFVAYEYSLSAQAARLAAGTALR